MPRSPSKWMTFQFPSILGIEAPLLFLGFVEEVEHSRTRQTGVGIVGRNVRQPNLSQEGHRDAVAVRPGHSRGEVGRAAEAGTPHGQLPLGHSFGFQPDGSRQQARKLICNSGKTTLACLIDDSLLGNFNSFRQRRVGLAGNCDRDRWRFRSNSASPDRCWTSW